MTVVFYISGHGFGHASREVEIINAFGAATPGVRVVLRTAVSPSLLERTLRVPYELHPGPCDTGIVQHTSVQHDDDATVREAVEFYATFDQRVRSEVDTLGSIGPHLIVGDIPPLAFAVARRLDVPSVAIGNFTWDWIYETHPGATTAAPHLVPLLREAYRHAAVGLELPFGGGFEVFTTVQKLPLVSRRPSWTREHTRRFFGLPEDRPAVLLSFGGYGMPMLDVSHLDCAGWTVVMTDRIQPPTPSRTVNVVHIDERRFVAAGCRYEDLVAAVDVVMSKPGYGIVSECIACDTPLLYTSRGVFREYDIFVREMPRYLRCRFMDQATLFAGRWRDALEALAAQPAPPETLDANGAEVAAEFLRQVST